jgi:hypothetical protein
VSIHLKQGEEKTDVNKQSPRASQKRWLLSKGLNIKSVGQRNGFGHLM